MLQLKQLQKTYAKTEREVLRGINLSIGPGEFVVVLGSSGAGKSTLIRCMNQLVLPTSGEIIWQGERITIGDRAQMRMYRRQIGMIFQDFHLLERSDVLTNVLVGRFGSMSMLRAITGLFPAADVAAAKAVLQRVRMEEYLYVKVKDLSGGQKQRVAIARALLQNPQLILGDEPVSNLDPVTADSILRLLQELCAERDISMLLNLHSIELAKRFATRIIGLAHGEIVFDDEPAQLSDTVLSRIYGELGTLQ